jgi:hypothetical protein
MPTLRQADQIVQNLPAISADGYEPIVIVGDYTVEAGLAANDVVEMVILPAGYVPVNAHLACEDTDSNGAPTITLDMGLISGAAGAKDNARTGGNEAFAASTVAQAGGVAVPTKKDFFLVAPSSSDRGFGVKLAAGAATLTAGAKWRLNLLARPALNGA